MKECQGATEKTLKLNHIDFHFFAMEDIVSSHGMVFMLRLTTHLDAEAVRDAVRRLLDFYPRFRSVIVPTWCSYRMHILAADDPCLGSLFNDAVRVRDRLHYDTPEYRAFLHDFLNEPYHLEHALPLKVRYLPDACVILLSVHHMSCDAIWFTHLTDALISILNGEPPKGNAAEYPSIIRHLLHRPLYRVPWQLATSGIILLHDLWKGRSQGTIPTSDRPAPCHGTIDVFVHTLPFDLDTLKTLSKTLNCSITVLLLQALAKAVSHSPGGNRGDKISILVQADIKPYLNKDSLPIGNYVHSPHILIPRHHWNTPSMILTTIKKQLAREIDHMKNHQILARFLINKLFSFLGRKLYARLQESLRHSRFLPNTCALSNIGNFDRFNSHGPKVQVAEAFVTTTAGCLFLVVSSMRDRCHVAFSYNESEFTLADITNFVQSFDHALVEMVENRTPR